MKVKTQVNGVMAWGRDFSLSPPCLNIFEKTIDAFLAL